ncbi:MAG: phosphohistidine phosphatase SixA [Candidatus Glassbacteria bacterium]|nr:phosphohistidine phosphatase SixA [Candidatus Glassbacteria bacterium]
MKLYLVRHGEAKTELEDVSKPLNEKGRQDVRHLGRTLKNMNVRVPRIVHSGRLRAEETAKLLADSLEGAAEVKKMKGLAPNDSIGPTLDWVNAEEEDLMIVGHLPFLASLLEELVRVSDPEELPKFDSGNLVGVERIGDSWQIFRHIGPNMIL